MEKEFEKYIDLSDDLRKGYKESLLPITNNWSFILGEIASQIPELFRIIYSKYSGTYYEINNQKLMDFVPGYLLIHISEFKKNFEDLKQILNNKNIKQKFLPILRNYSSDFYALNVNTNEIFLIFHDEDEIDLIHKTPDDFLLTLRKNYEEHVYFLDEDGFLDYDEDLEFEVGSKYNEDVDFWNE
ncbi:MAG: hypothetical protein LBE92_03015 [Chryseobacterium sp.]|jgi:hypothetical protein|uniref:hypothetical protein n=1 Tax=Chryseobacterium sp. TaxID=1871047 RepID=UPI002834FC23|nr:hypothetical protein [Chryseobacterium sp.]MDR2235070.1 hypothetical protein [Chryseobacterium sp.]